MREGLSRRLQGAYSSATAAASFPQGVCCIHVMLLEVTAEPPTLVTLSCYLLICHCGCGAVPGSVLAAEVVQVKSNYFEEAQAERPVLLLQAASSDTSACFLPSEVVPDVCFLDGAEPAF